MKLPKEITLSNTVLLVDMREDKFLLVPKGTFGRAEFSSNLMVMRSCYNENTITFLQAICRLPMEYLNQIAIVPKLSRP